MSQPADQTIRVLSVLPVLGHPRDSKRISMLQESGCTVEAAAFERDYHTGRMPTCPVTSLGHIAHGKYLQRAVKVLKALPTLRRAMRRNDAAYASGPDMALAAIIAGAGLGKPVVLEVGDIRSVQVSRTMKGRVMRTIERFIVKHSKLLVVTAPGFVDGYYDKWLHSATPTMVLENKLDAEAMKAAGVPEPAAAAVPGAASAAAGPGKPLRIGYFGVLRCEWSWHVLEALARARPNDVRIVVAGYVMEPADLEARARALPNVEWRGRYKSPVDLPALYSSVDVVWACYPPPEVKEPDWRWAQGVCRSNRFYESCYFRKPIISVAGSGDAEDVSRYDLGPVLTDQGTDAVIAALGKINAADLQRWGRNLAALPRSVFLYTQETEDLRRAMADMTVGSRANA